MYVSTVNQFQVKNYKSLGGIAFAVQTIPPISTHFSVARSVCLSVCHIRAPCLNRSTDSDGIWQVHLWGFKDTLCSMGVPNPQGKGDLGSNPQPKKTKLQIAAKLPPGKYKRGVSDYAFCQITSVFAFISLQASRHIDR